jgi:hypothetical protein
MVQRLPATLSLCWQAVEGVCIGHGLLANHLSVCSTPLGADARINVAAHDE